MALTLRRGTSRVFQLTLENCDTQDFIWQDFGKIRVRLSQGRHYIDKYAQIDPNDPTACLVYYSQEDSIGFSEEIKAKLQVFLLKESEDHQLAIKSKTFDVIIEESLWNEVITDGNYSGTEVLTLDDPEYSQPIGHDYYSYLHLNIKEFSGIISNDAGAVVEGSDLYYDSSNETLFASSEDNSGE